ncbi:MAG TPA: hypothetical protein VHZ81_11260 [Galbitalea sp.]|jgi:hypothetical protein|nr:hypothetical protein [Galbitalea sp.]
MGFTGLDGGIMVALAAGLWLVYLLPTWFKRREYAALEKTNVRRQQAMRVLQETEPIPVRERVEAIVTPTGQVANPDKLAEAITRSRDAQAARVASRQFAEEATGAGQAASAKVRIARRLRRTRAVVSLILVAALVTAIIQVALMVTGGIAAGAWPVLGFAAVGAVVSFAALGRLAAIARRRQSLVVPQVRPMRTRVAEEREAARPPVTTWTPVAVPKPLYLSRAEAPAVRSTVDPHEQLRAAALESDRALREAQESPEVSPIVAPERPAAPPSKYAAMGVLGSADVTGTDLDEVLRRRRAG